MLRKQLLNIVLKYHLWGFMPWGWSASLLLQKPSEKDIEWAKRIINERSDGA